VHEVDWFGDRGDAIGVYAVAKMKDGSAYVEIMNRRQVDQVRAVSRSKNSGPWTTWWEEMWRKSVIRRLAKRLPLSTDLDGVIHEDDEMFMPPEQPAAPAQPPADPPPADTPRRPSRLAKVAEQAPPPPEPADDDGVIDMPPAPPAIDEDSPI
jgi:recombination protein RecT